MLLFRAFSFKKKEFMFVLTGADSRAQPTLDFASRKTIFFFSCPRLQVANWQQMGRIGPADVVVQPERSVIEAKLSCYIERSSLSGPCLHHSLCLGSIVTPLSGPLGIRVCNLRFRLRKCAFQAKNPPCYDSLVIFHHGTHSYVLLALLQ